MAAQPIDVVALVQVVFTGLAALLSAFAGVYAIVAANRARRAEKVSVDNAGVIQQVKDNTDGMTTQIAELSRREGVVEGIERGAATAAVLARGQREGREQSANETALRAGGDDSEEPVSVADDRTAAAAERSASATERVARAAEKDKEKK